MLMLYVFPIAILGALVATAADAARFRSLLGVRAGNGLILGGLAASYVLALAILALNPSYEDNNSVSRLDVPGMLIWALELAGWLALAVVPIAFGLWGMLHAWKRRRLDRSAEPAVRRMGDGFEPHIDEIDGRLFYSQLVGFGPSEAEFRFPIRQSDLAVLHSDPWRRAVLEAVADRVLQYSTMPGRTKVTNAHFRWIARGVLHSTPDRLDRLIARVDRDYNSDVAFFAREALARRDRL